MYHESLRDVLLLHERRDGHARLRETVDLAVVLGLRLRQLQHRGTRRGLVVGAVVLVLQLSILAPVATVLRLF